MITRRTDKIGAVIKSTIVAELIHAIRDELICTSQEGFEKTVAFQSAGVR